MELSGAETRLDAVDAGKLIAQRQPAGMTASAMEEIVRRHNARMKSTMFRTCAGEARCSAGSVGAARTLYRCNKVIVRAETPESE